MAKGKTYGDKQRTGSKHGASGRTVMRDSKSGQFTLGRDAFRRVSEVEGIVVSRSLKADLHRLGSASPEKRRATLTQKYGKK